jgi:two-component system, cell cycle sensor histidine kinase and response regulator CckA
LLQDQWGEAEHQVLLVEDNPGDADLTTERLAEGPGGGFGVRHVTSLQTAVRALDEAAYDAIILDLHLPDSSGFATVENITTRSRGAPVIVVSGSIDEDLRRGVLERGAEEVFAKEQSASHLFSRAVLYVIQRNRARASQKRLEELLDAAPDAVLVMDRQKIVRYASRAALELLGQRREDIVGQHLDVPLDDLQVLELPVQGGTETRVYEARVVPFDWEGRPASIASLQDVTVERQNRARFERLSECGLIGIFTADLGGILVAANSTFLGTIGSSLEAVLDRKVRWADLLPPSSDGPEADLLERLRSHGFVPAFEVDLLRADGTAVPVLIGAALVGPSEFIAYTADMTERRALEVQSQRAAAQLRRTEEQLRQAQKMEAVGRLAGGVAHDFNNILSVILTFAELVKSDLDPEDTRRSDLDEIVRAGERASALTRQLLLFSRQQVVDPSSLNLNELLVSMTRMLERVVGEDIDLQLVTDPDIGRILADHGSIEQMLMNLVINARDAMPTGGQLTIETSSVVLDEAFAREHVGSGCGPHVMLAVTDSGVGMDKATQSQIFEPFFTTKELGKGTGLGLSTAFGIVRRCRGSIWVYSEVGRGTTFKVYFPCTDQKPSPRPSDAAEGPMVGTETILVLEDDDHVRLAAVGILRRLGYRVLEARSGPEAFEICESESDPIDLLLSDVVLPGQSGPAVAKALLELRPTMCVLCMSGYTDDSVVRHGALTADIPFIQKPLTPALLAKKVREVLANSPYTRRSNKSS